jgi:hypothetical protein
MSKSRQRLFKEVEYELRKVWSGGKEEKEERQEEVVLKSGAVLKKAAPC